ncbi:type III secretion inner membrane ring lipoprotein SctJ [Citrobacter freundii]|nr:type III secretion inner membrane ring lipoprotein SctJ [Citrobacter freundii]
MKHIIRLCSVIVIGILLSACKTDLYTGLTQAEANQMSVVLSSRHINVESVIGKDGSVTLSVDKTAFATAVELLRLHGYPEKKYLSVEDLFPGDQLVTSPGQEQTKIVYLREQNLERMLADMDGVVSVRVAIAAPIERDDGAAPESASVAAFIKYAPDVAMNNETAHIKGLIHAGVPDVAFDKISVVLQPAQYLMGSSFTPEIPMTPHRFIQQYGMWGVMTLLICAWLGFGVYVLVVRAKRQAEDGLA